VKAKRGDLVVVEYVKDYGSRRPEFEIERVASVARDGLVLATRKVMSRQEMDPEPLFRSQTSAGHTYRRPRVYYRSHVLLPNSDADLDAVWQAWIDRTPTEGRYNYFPEAFASLDEVRAFVAPFRAASVA
jgi:hypothetical protein